MSDQEIESMLEEALRLLEAGAAGEAAEIYHQILAANPDTPDAWNNLALIDYQRGRFNEAAEAAARATGLRPQIPPYWLTRGNIAVALREREDAEASYSRAIDLAPEFAEAHYRRALGRHNEQRVAAAIAGYREALRYAPEVGEIHFHLAEALTLEARFEEAMPAYHQAFMRDPDGEFERRGCFDSMRYLQFQSLPEFWRSEITQFFSRADVDKTRYANVGLKALAVQRAFRVMLSVARQRDAAFEPGSVALREVMQDELFTLLLRDALIADREFENLLTRLRAALLQNESLRAAAPLEFLCALAAQCFMNEHVFGESAAEIAAAADLQREVEGQLRIGGAVPATLARSVAVLAMYRPLHLFAGIEPWAAQAGHADALAELLRRAVTQMRTERELRGQIRVIGEVSDTVPREVRGMHEEQAYPRWVSCDRWAPLPFGEWLEREVPMLDRSRAVAAAPRILVAGCGTGQDAIWLATDIAGASVLAVDLSLTSLAYAQRMANELNVRNIEFRHGEILGLGALTERFDFVYSKGVLHHMREPVAGLRVLSGLLGAGGLLKIGLDSERARASVNAARAIIRERQIAPTAAAIRELRQEIYAAAPDSPLRPLSGFTDFYSTSMCRDLIFHVREHQFRLPQVVAMLREQELSVLGLADLQRTAIAAFSQMFPGASVATDFQAWDAFEARHPETFMNMYQVWSLRPEPA